LLSIDEVEIQLAEMKEDISSKFKKTEAMLQSGELPPTAEESVPPQKKKSIVIKQEAVEVSIISKKNQHLIGTLTLQEDVSNIIKKEEPVRKPRGRPPKKAYTLAAKTSENDETVTRYLN